METNEPVQKRRSVRRSLKSLPQNISKIVEHFFYSLGLQIAQKPIKWILGTSLIVLLCLAGLVRFHQEKNPLKLWVPPDSDFVKDTEWLLSHFTYGQRVQTVIFTADDIFEPHALYELNEITKRMMLAETREEPKLSWTDICFKIPIISGYTNRQTRDIKDDFFDEEPAIRMNNSKFDPSVHVPTKLYCDILNSLPRGCVLISILDLWEYNSDIILNQTKDDIIMKINSAKVSPTLGHPINFTELLGGITTDYLGRIIGAKAVKTQLMLHVDFTKVNMNVAGNDVGTSDWATIDVLNWESALLEILHASAHRLRVSSREIGQPMDIWYEAGRSFGDISESTMFQDISKILTGATMMTLYVLFILSRFNWVELRFWLTIAGLLCIGGAFIVAIGLCSLFGVPYGPVHSSLPFMLMGLGVDDIFVMMASWKEVLSHDANRAKSIDQRIGMMLSHAGAAISITSLTDVVAFIIGASTILPSLESFCIYAAVGVLVTFLLQVTFFVAFFTLDVKRIEQRRNGVIPWIIHEKYEPSLIDPRRTFSWRAIHWLYTKIVLTLPGKLIIVIITLVITIIAGLGTAQLKQWFDPNWFLPKGSYLSDYIVVHNQQFPSLGYPAGVFIGDIDYVAEYPKIMTLTEKFNNLSIIDHVETWPGDFADFAKRNYAKDITSGVLSSKDFYFYLSKFLFSQQGGRYQRNFQFAGNLTCGEATPKILLSCINFAFTTFTGPDQWIPAMDNAKLVVKEVGFSSYATIWGRVFGAWVTDKVIAREVTRNIILALICVMATTAVLIAEPQTCIWIFICVTLTLVDVCGFMYYWGLSVDIVSCIALELAVGLSVDYAAHVAHAFLNSDAPEDTKNRTTRSLIAVRHIGAAVMYGAGSTLLAQSLLSLSEAYVFRTFFKIFLLVILFGIWHGLFLLPVILSTIGPRSLHIKDNDKEINNTEVMMDKNEAGSSKETEAHVPLNTIEAEN